MKFIVFSDLHLHSWTYGATIEDGMNSRLAAQASVLEQIGDYAREHEIIDIIFCGDFFHTHGKLSADVLKVAYEGVCNLHQLGSNLFFIVGNHDTAMQNMSVHSLHWLKAFGSDTNTTYVIDEPSHWLHILDDDKDIPVHMLPYTEDKKVLTNFLDNPKILEDSFVFLHQGVSKVPMASGFVVNEMLKPEMIPDRIKHAFTGHYHTHKKVTDKLTVIGSVMQHTWADAGDKRGWLVVDSDTGEYELVESKAPKFEELGSINDVGFIEVENNFVRVGFSDDTKADREELLKMGARSVEFTEHKEDRDGKVFSITTENFQLDKVIEKYEKIKSVDEKTHDVGQALLQDKYEVPKM